MANMMNLEENMINKETYKNEHVSYIFIRFSEHHHQTKNLLDILYEMKEFY